MGAKMPTPDWDDEAGDGEVLDTSPEDISQNTGATAVGEPAGSITGALADYANRVAPPANSLGLLMDDQQMRDAGIYREEPGTPTYSMADATGAQNPQADPAGGYTRAIEDTRKAVTGAHTFASIVAKAPSVISAGVDGISDFAKAPGAASAEAAWNSVKAAESAVANHPVVSGLKVLNKIVSVPAYAAEGVSRGMADYRNGAPLGETILGNGLRTGLVVGSGFVPVAGPGLAWAANRYLPDGAAMGHGIIKGLSDPDQSRAALGIP